MEARFKDDVQETKWWKYSEEEFKEEKYGLKTWKSNKICLWFYSPVKHDFTTDKLY
jgi:hypothetical protein